MHIAGIIAEYDPFHLGHKAHIDATRREAGATHIVAIISGSFTQRGEPAMLTKFRRADMALKNGVDLVLELPLPWAMAPAEQFALGGVASLHALGCVDTLSFGSECGEVATLIELAQVADTPAYVEALRQALDTGVPYAAAQQAAAVSLLGDKGNAFAEPNNTLAISYIQAARRLGAAFDFFTIRRQGAAHGGEPQTGYASAGWLRTQVRSGQANAAKPFMPPMSFDVMADALTAGEAPADAQRLESALLACLRSADTARLAALPYVSEGLENRIRRGAQSAATVDDLLTALKTKRYPLARLRRLLWAALLELDTHWLGKTPPYLRVLGMNDRGKEILSAAKPTLPLLTRTAQVKDLNEKAQTLFELECRATDLHALTLPRPLPCGTDRTNKLIVL